MRIKIYPRIAINLISMHDAEYRHNGGIGFSIKKPSLVLDIIKSKKFELNDNRKIYFESDEQKRLLKILKNEYKRYNFKYKISIQIKGVLPTHCGFGSSTAIRLACLEALYIINKHKYTKIDLINSSRRGGTSGIGINTYFDGGYVFDIGKKTDDKALAPSSIEQPSQIPLKLINSDMPRWDIGICIPNDISSKSEEEEKEFFKRVCPIDESDTYEMLYHTVYGVISAIQEEDFEMFCNAIKSIQNSKWKKSEREQYGEKLKNIEDILYQNGAKAVGMSSMGPMLYFMAEDIKSVIKNSKNESDCVFFKTQTNNKGRKIES